MAVDRLRLARLEGKRDAIASCLSTMAANTSDVRLENGLLRVLALSTRSTARDAGRSAPPPERAPSLAASSTSASSHAIPQDPQALDGLIRCVVARRDQRASVTDTRLPRDAHRARSCDRATSSLRALLAFAAGVLDESAGRASDAEAAYTLRAPGGPGARPGARRGAPAPHARE